jgi:ubiquitin carboxyl-terminal hydrolase 5/13
MPVNEEERKITKLAIGLPGGLDPEAEKWETSVSVYCHHCGKYLDHKVPKIASVVDSVLLAQSAYDAAAVSEWELKLNPCEHTLMLDQSNAKPV